MSRKLVSVLLALVMCATALAVGAFAESGAKAVAGELPKAAFSLADGADVVCYEFGASSRFGATRFFTLTFDASRGDLLLDVSRGGEAPAGRTLVSARGGGANERFALEGGAIAFASGESAAFGVGASGEAMIGLLGASVEIRDRSAAIGVVADAVNRDGKVTVYSGGETPPCDKYRIAIECPADGLLVPGVPVEGVVTACASPGQALGEDGAITVAGDASLADFAPGDIVTVTADIRDALGNTAAWRTVDSSVGGSALLGADGAAYGLGDELVTSSVIGIRGDGMTVILSFAKGSGMRACDLFALCAELGLSDAFAVDCGGTLALVDPNGEADEAPELPDVAEQLTSPIWLLKHMKAEPVGDAPKAIPQTGADDGASSAVAEAQSADAQEYASDGYEPTSALLRQIEFDSTGEWLTLVINESDVEAWYGKIF